MTTRLQQIIPRIGPMRTPRFGMLSSRGGMAAQMGARARPLQLRNTTRAYSSSPSNNPTSTNNDTGDFVRQRDALKLLWGAALASVGFCSVNLYNSSQISKKWSTIANELEPKTYGLSLEFTNSKAENDKREMKRENARQKGLRKDTYNHIREIQKELQKINPGYRPDDGAFQWREAEKDFAKYTTIQLHELQREMRRINPNYRSSQGAPQDKDAKSKPEKDIIHGLQRALRKVDPDYEPGWGAYHAARKCREELCAISHAVLGSRSPPVKAITGPPRKPDINSKDAVESLAAKFKDPELRQHYRAGWDHFMTESYHKDDIREMVDDHMGVFGVQWPKEGNPFGTDDDDDI
ncbi:MAG: hypothetical protein Q9184_001373 [Pyrenodesmia sp. 2 TL-2023]